jgi:hypothetical protein
MNVGQRDFDAFLGRNVYACDARHVVSPRRSKPQQTQREPCEAIP